MRRWIALCVAAGLWFSAACSSNSGDTSAGLQVNGQAEVAGPGEPWAPFSGERSVHDRDRVRILQGSGIISVSDDRQVELRSGSEVAVALAEDREPGVVLATGDVLVTAPQDEFTVSTDELTASIRGGAARLSRGTAVVVGAYTTDVRLESAGQTMTVPRLRQAGVSQAGILPARGPIPLVYSATDPWDQRFLSEAVLLKDELTARSSGFTAQVPQGRPQTPDFFRQLLPELANEPLDARVAAPRPPGESLVGLAIAVTGQGGTFAQRWDSVVAFRDAGADWGLVALDQRSPRVPLLSDIDAAIGRGLAVLLGPTSPAAPGPTPGPPPAASAASGTGSQPSTQAAPPPARSTPTTAPPAATTENPGPLRTGIAPVDSAANSLINLLSGLLNSLGK